MENVKITNMSNMTPEHRDVIDNLIGLTRFNLKNSVCFAMREAKYSWPEDIDKNGKQINREPDFSILCGARKRKRLIYTDVPRLIIEVLSDSTENIDRNEKKDLYLKVGVEEYWLIDPRTLTIERYILDDNGEKFILHDKINRFSDEEIKNTISPLSFPLLLMPFDKIFMGIGSDL